MDRPCKDAHAWLLWLLTTLRVFRPYLASCLIITAVAHSAMPAVVRAQPAQEEDAGYVRVNTDWVRLSLGGGMQARLSYSQDRVDDSERLGIGLRRVRLVTRADFPHGFGFYVQLAGDNLNPDFLDAALEFRAHPFIRFRLGRFVVAQPYGFALTSYRFVDALDRAVIAAEWGARTIGDDGRDFALETQFLFPEFQLRIAWHNGDGSWDRLRGNTRDDLLTGSPTRGTTRYASAVSIVGAWTPQWLPGLHIGAYLSWNEAQNPNTAIEGRGRDYLSYAAHVYWGVTPGEQLVRIKLDVIGIVYGDLPLEEKDDVVFQAQARQHYLGYQLFTAVLLHPSVEGFVRFEGLHPDDPLHEAQRVWFSALGAHFSSSALRSLPFEHERLTLQWAARWDAQAHMQAHQVLLQAQLVF